MLTKRALAKVGFVGECRVARNGLEAISILGLLEGMEGLFHPDLVLLDLKLPYVNGHEVLRRIRACPRTQDLCVVVLSTSDEPEDIASVKELGAGYLRKPVDYDEFLKTVAAVVASPASYC